MLTHGWLAQAKALLAECIAAAYRQRERVALIVFSGAGVTLALHPQRARHAPEHWLRAITAPIGGGTPLATALRQAETLLQRQPAPRWLWLLSDVRTRALPPRPAHAERLLIVDCDNSQVPLGRARQLAQAWGDVERLSVER